MRRNTSGGSRQNLRNHDASSQLAQRLEAIERLVVEQRQQLAQQEQELRQLRGSLAADAAPDVASAPHLSEMAEPATAPAERSKKPLLTSRRALLMAGGATAAVAAVEAVALTHGGPTALAHGAKAELGGIAWQTGTVLADEETLVKPSSASYASNDLLQVQLGTGTVYSPTTLKAAITAYDTTTNNIGVYASSQTGYGLWGVTDSGDGAHGAGLGGSATGGVGVSGISANGIGVSGTSASGLGGSFTGGQAAIALGLGFNSGAPTSGNHVAGEIYADFNANLWLCTSPGTPGSWQQLALLPSGATGGGGVTYLAKPIRLLDTRGGDSLAKTDGGGPIAGGYPTGAPYTLTIAGVNWQSVQVPFSVGGAIGNVTVVSGSGGGYLAIVPQGAGFSGTATLAYGPNQVVGNSFNTGLTNGQLDILVGSSASSSTDVILDLIAVVA